MVCYCIVQIFFVFFTLASFSFLFNGTKRFYDHSPLRSFDKFDHRQLLSRIFLSVSTLISLHSSISNPYTMEAKSNDGPEIGERADAVQHTETTVQSSHASRSLLFCKNQSRGCNIMPYSRITIYFALLFLQFLPLKHSPIINKRHKVFFPT